MPTRSEKGPLGDEGDETGVVDIVEEDRLYYIGRIEEGGESWCARCYVILSRAFMTLEVSADRFPNDPPICM